jgi:transcription elongation factor Elf1
VANAKAVTYSFQRTELAGKRLKTGWVSLRCEFLILEAMEHFFVCPYCGERISMVLDTSVKGQTYVEDCEVCCQPVEVRYAVKDDEVSHFEARAM